MLRKQLSVPKNLLILIKLKPKHAIDHTNFTSLFIANKIYRQALNPFLPETFDSPVYAIEADNSSEEIKYNIKELTH